MNPFEQRWRDLARRAGVDDTATTPPPALGPLLDALATPRAAPIPRWQLALVGALSVVAYLALAPLALRLLPTLEHGAAFDLAALPKPPAYAAPELPAPPRLPSLAALTDSLSIDSPFTADAEETTP